MYTYIHINIYIYIGRMGSLKIIYLLGPICAHPGVQKINECPLFMAGCTKWYVDIITTEKLPYIYIYICLYVERERERGYICFEQGCLDLFCGVAAPGLAAQGGLVVARTCVHACDRAKMRACACMLFILRPRSQRSVAAALR